MQSTFRIFELYHLIPYTLPSWHLFLGSKAPFSFPSTACSAYFYPVAINEYDCNLSLNNDFSKD
jgi:hypothetical protein